MFEKEEPQEEYIVTSSDVYNAHKLYSESGYADSIGKFYKSLERIVRCKDCKHLVGVGIDFYYCELFRARGPYDYELHKPAYDGFCTWGEPKD